MTLPSILIATDANPRTSGRVAEAIRVAAGIGAWKQVRVHLFLGGQAVLALDEYADELVDGNLISDYLEAVREHGGTIYVDGKSAAVDGVRQDVPVERANSAEFHRVLEQVKYTMRF